MGVPPGIYIICQQSMRMRMLSSWSHSGLTEEAFFSETFLVIPLKKIVFSDLNEQRYLSDFLLMFSMSNIQLAPHRLSAHYKLGLFVTNNNALFGLYLSFQTANKANKDFTQGILDIEDLVGLGQKHRWIMNGFKQQWDIYCCNSG